MEIAPRLSVASLPRSTGRRSIKRPARSPQACPGFRIQYERLNLRISERFGCSSGGRVKYRASVKRSIRRQSRNFQNRDGASFPSYRPTSHQSPDQAIASHCSDRNLGAYHGRMMAMIGVDELIRLGNRKRYDSQSRHNYRARKSCGPPASFARIISGGQCFRRKAPTRILIDFREILTWF